MKTTNNNNKIAIIIPAYNEGTVIGSVIKGLPSHISNTPVDVIVVDDSSSDNTGDMARESGAKVIRHFLNLGAGGATATGLQYARERSYAYTVTMDADGQHTSEDCIRVIKELKNDNADLVIGSRLIDPTGMPAHRIIGNKGLNFITYLIFRITVSDTQSGLKGFSRKALQEINIKTSGMEFCSEIIWRAKQKGLVISEIPIKAIYTEYSKQKGQSNWNGFNIIKNLIKRKLLDSISA